MRWTAGLFALGVLIAVAPFAAGVSSRRVLLVALSISFVLLLIASIRALVAGPNQARLAVFFGWGAVAALVWAAFHIQVVGPPPAPGHSDQGIQPIAAALIVAGTLFVVTLLLGLWAALAESRSTSKVAPPKPDVPHGS